MDAPEMNLTQHLRVEPFPYAYLTLVKNASFAGTAFLAVSGSRVRSAGFQLRRPGLFLWAYLPVCCRSLAGFTGGLMGTKRVSLAGRCVRRS
jgi:hypothetical protein